MADLLEVRGEVLRELFKADSGYTVLLFLSDEKERFSVTGFVLSSFEEGEHLVLQGRFVEHPRFGRQFEALLAKRQDPEGREGHIRFLASSQFPGVGRKTAAKIFDALGPNLWQDIARDPHVLATVEGLSPKVQEVLLEHARFSGQQEEVLPFLYSLGFGPELSMRILQQYPLDTKGVITENPYRLAEEVPGIGFKRADRVALELGLPPEHPDRMRAAVLFSLREETSSGHVYLPRTELVAKVITYLAWPDPEPVHAALSDLAQSRVIVAEDEAIYLATHYRAEEQLAVEVIRLTERALPLISTDMEDLQAQLQLQFAAEQKQAIEHALTRPISIITGGPGTGKTQVVRAVIKALRDHDGKARILLAAPTGRAAQRISEVTGDEAQTIHRMLEWGKDPNGRFSFGRNATSPLRADLLIVDEFSMVDIFLGRALFNAIGDNTRLVLVGDKDQLPSIGPGEVLRDLLQSGLIATTTLKQIFRQSLDSNIPYVAQTILRGEVPNPTAGYTVVHLKRNETPLADVVQKHVDRLLAKGLSWDDVQILTPLRQRKTGSEEMNLWLRERYNGTSEVAIEGAGKRLFRLRDKVMQVRNNYEKEVFNGDVGYVRAVTGDDVKEIVVDFARQEVFYARAELEQLQLAYAVTVHKSQGSEYRAVVLVLAWDAYTLLRRNLLYTAITRAKDEVVVITEPGVMERAVSLEVQDIRYGRLPDRLRSLTEFSHFLQKQPK